MSNLLLIGFFLSAYAVVANDSIQTLGTFLLINKENGIICGFGLVVSC